MDAPNRRAGAGLDLCHPATGRAGCGPIPTRWTIAGFGCDLGIFDIAISGDVIVPQWSLLAACLAFPAARLYRRCRPARSRRPDRGFEPLIGS